MAGSNNTYGLDKLTVDSCADRLRIGYLKQLDDLLIQGCLFFGNSFVRSHVVTSLNIIDSSFNCGNHEENEDVDLDSEFAESQKEFDNLFKK